MAAVLEGAREALAELRRRLAAQNARAAEAAAAAEVAEAAHVAGAEQAAAAHAAELAAGVVRRAAPCHRRRHPASPAAVPCARPLASHRRVVT